MSPAFAPAFDYGSALVRAWQTNQQVNLHLLEHFQGRIWRRTLEGQEPHCRTIASLFVHLHNVQCTVLERNAEGEAPKRLERVSATKAQVRAGLRRTDKALTALLQQVLFSGKGRLRKERPDVVQSITRLIAHDAHHRGQIALLAALHEEPLTAELTEVMWSWRPE